MATPISYYKYTPSLAVAVLAAVLYGIAFIGTVIQFLRLRAWVWSVMVLAAGMEVTGYIFRAISSQNLDNQILYIVQFVLVVLAPVIMAGACYVVFGRIVFHVVPKEARTLRLLWISPRWLTPIFVVFDIIALIVQLLGAIKLTAINTSSSPATINKDAASGKKIAMTGVALQLICFGLFTIIAIRFNFTARRFQSADLLTSGEKFVKVEGNEKKVIIKDWRALLRVVNLACGCILIRSIYRMVEFSLGHDGYPQTHEWVPYCFDTLPIFPVVAMFVYWHPARYLPYMGFRLPKSVR